MEVPPNSLDKEEVNTNYDLGWRALGGDGGRKEPAITIIAGASSWRGSFTQCGGIPRMMAGSMVVVAEQVGPIHKADKTSALDANFNIIAHCSSSSKPGEEEVPLLKKKFEALLRRSFGLSMEGLGGGGGEEEGKIWRIQKCF